MIYPKNNLPLSAHKQLKKVMQASLTEEHKKDTEANSEDNKQAPTEEHPKKQPSQGQLDLYV